MTEQEVLKKKEQCESKVIAGGVLVGLSFVLFIPTMGMTMIPFIGGAILIALTLRDFERVSEEFKSTYVKQSLSELVPGAKFDSTGGFSQNEVLDTRLVRRTDRFKSEDYLSGTVNNFPFYSCDVVMEDVHHDKHGSHTVTVFKGRFYRIDFPSEFSSDFVVLQPTFGLKWQFTDYQAVETESVDFNENLKVFAKDELLVREIITPPFMERLMEMDAKYKDKIGLSFMNNHLYVAINSNQDPFDLRLFHPVNTSYAAEIKEEIDNINTFLDLLDLRG